MHVEFDRFTFDSDLRVLQLGDQSVHLTPKAFQLLGLLLENRPRPVATDAIMACIWPGSFVARGSLANLVLELREALGDDGRAARYIRTVHRYGYVFCGATSPPVPFDTRAVAPPRARLVTPEGPMPLREGETRIGRSEECAVILDCPGASRRHACLLFVGGHATIEDLGSRNGTFVNDAKIEGVTPLSDGDRIMVGTVMLVYRVSRPAPSTANLVLDVPPLAS